MKKIAFFIATILFCGTALAQSRADSAKYGIGKFAVRNFSELRTFNIYWETLPNYNYSLKNHGNEIEKGRVKTANTFMFQTTMPVFATKNRRFSIFVKGEVNMNHFCTSLDGSGLSSPHFNNDNNNHFYYSGGLVLNYQTRLFKRMLILTASTKVDGWNWGAERIQNILMGIMPIKHTQKNTVSLGLIAMFPYNYTPAIPFVTWTHRFDSNWILDFSLPVRLYLRYQNGRNRFSVGSTLDSQGFYIRPNTPNLPQTCYFNQTRMKCEFVYECILNKRFFLVARAGGDALIKGGFYNTDREGIDRSNPYVKITRAMQPFANVGISYNLFK